MTSRVRITEKMFWEYWPKVRNQFPTTPEVFVGWMRTRGGHCPITAVAALLGADLPIYYPDGSVGDVVRLRAEGVFPKWAERIIAVADGYEIDQYPSIAKKLSA